MLFLRSLLCQAGFYLNFFVHATLTPVFLLVPKAVSWIFAMHWARMTIYFWRITTGSSVEWRGMENLPEGGFIIAAKHQSTWETLALGAKIPNLTFIMKRELMYIPIFGWFAWKTGMIPINRGKGAKAIAPMLDDAKRAVDNGRRIVIFMEGTRMAPGTHRAYKVGVARLYEALDCPVVPIALNTGLTWPRNGFWRYTGKVIVDILPPIMPGLGQDDLLKTLQDQVETASNDLILEIARDDAPPPTITKALIELEKRGVDISPAR